MLQRTHSLRNSTRMLLQIQNSTTCYDWMIHADEGFWGVRKTLLFLTVIMQQSTITQLCATIRLSARQTCSLLFIYAWICITILQQHLMLSYLRMKTPGTQGHHADIEEHYVWSSWWNNRLFYKCLLYKTCCLI